MKEPFFSIVIPIYNAEDYLCECLDSIKNQTFTNWETILVDDGSTDDSLSICKRYRIDDSRFKVFSQPHLGPLNARLIGRDQAKGHYYLEINSDDYINIKSLEIINKTIDESQCDVVAWNIRCFGDDDNLITYGLTANNQYSIQDFMQAVVNSANHSLCNKAIPLEYIKDTDYSSLQLDIQSASDYAICGAALASAASVYVIPDELYLYRRIAGSITHKNTLKMAYDMLRVSEFTLDKWAEVGTLTKELFSCESELLLLAIYERIWNAFVNDTVESKYYILIHDNSFYKQLKEYERIGKLNWFQYLILKLFRNQQYWLIQLLAKVRGINGTSK